MTNRRFRPVAWVFLAVLPLAGLQQAVALDCNLNGVPDHCDVDCSPPGCLQYACSRSDDTNPQNGIPDECEGAPAVGTFTSTADFTTLGTLINLDESVPGQLSRSQLPRPMPNLWVAASHRGTIVRINTKPGDALGDVVGEYFTAPDGRGKNPSRTAVNLDGEVWVSNRSEGSQFGFGSITRIGVLNGGTLVPPIACEADNRATFAPPFAYNTCVDRNGDGMITTSNGLIPLPWAYEDTTPPQVRQRGYGRGRVHHQLRAGDREKRRSPGGEQGQRRVGRRELPQQHVRSGGRGYRCDSRDLRRWRWRSRRNHRLRRRPMVGQHHRTPRCFPV